MITPRSFQTSVRGLASVAPDRYGHMSRPSTAGRPASAARVSFLSTPARAANVA